MVTTTLLKISLTLEERLCLSILVGPTASTTLVYLLSCWQQRLDFLSIATVLVFITLASILILKKRKILGGKHITRNLNPEILIVILFGIVAFLVLNLSCVMREEAGSLYGSGFVWGDYGFHTSVINSFVLRNNFPPQYPMMANTSMGYPPTVDFLSSILIKTGFDLKSSIIIPNMLFQVSILCLVASLAIRLVKRKYVGILSVVLFFFAGNMGIIYALSDMPNYGGFTNWITNLPTDYSGSGISELPGLRFGNPVAVMLMPQRPSTLGIGLSLIVYILALHALKNKGSTRELIFAGIITGLLPIVHPHSFIAVVTVLFLLIIWFRKGLRFFAYLFVPAAVLSLPQILAIQSHVGERFMGFMTGFPGVDWFKVIGVIIFPLVLGLLRSDRTISGFYFPFFVLFLLGNFVRFQPWAWDNYKIFLHWYILTLVIASYGIIEIARFSFNHLRPIFRAYRLKKSFRLPRFDKRRLMAVLGVVSLGIILFLSTATGFLSHAKMLQEHYLMWSEADVTFADWIRENTPSESVFLTSTYHLHPVVTLAGRQIVLGYEGWLWSHGIDWNHIREVKRDVIEMFRGDYALIKKYGVDFISITHYERDFASSEHFTINMEFFNESGYFEKVYDRTLNGKSYVIFQVT